MKSQFDRDLHLFEYFDAVGSWCMSRDLGISERAVKARVTRLKKCGAWDVLREYRRDEKRHTAAYFDALGISHFIDKEVSP